MSSWSSLERYPISRSRYQDIRPCDTSGEAVVIGPNFSGWDVTRGYEEGLAFPDNDHSCLPLPPIVCLGASCRTLLWSLNPPTFCDPSAFCIPYQNGPSQISFCVLKWYSLPQCWRYERMTRGPQREHYQWKIHIWCHPYNTATPISPKTPVLAISRHIWA